MEQYKEMLGKVYSQRGRDNLSPRPTSANVNSIDLWSMFGPKSQQTIVSPEMAYFCFDIVLSKLRNKHTTIRVEFPEEEYPLFVTWTKVGQEQVRGCYGTFDPVPIKIGLTECAISSALSDAQLPPIKFEELPDFEVTVAILCDFEGGKHFLDWKIGVHGLQLEVQDTDMENVQVANLLPDYPIQMGWTKMETVDALMRKAGYTVKITSEERRAIKITRFKAQKVTRNYGDFNAFRSWKSKNGRNASGSKI